MMLLLFLPLFLFVNPSIAENVTEHGGCQSIPIHNILNFQCPPFNDLHCIRSMITRNKNGAHPISCALMESSKNPEMKIVNATELISALQHSDPYGRSFCSVVMFFAPNCVFSQRIAGYVYLLAKLFPQLQVYAVNLHQRSSILDHLINQHGIAATPIILLFENNIAKIRLYDESNSLRSLADILVRKTDLKLPPGIKSEELYNYGVETEEIRDQYNQFITQFFNFEEVATGIDRYYIFACIILFINLAYFLHFSSKISQFWPAQNR